MSPVHVPGQKTLLTASAPRTCRRAQAATGLAIVDEDALWPSALVRDNEVLGYYEAG